MFKVLEIIGDTAMESIDLFEGFLDAGYDASRGKILYATKKRRRAREASANTPQQRYYNLMYRLKRDRLIDKRTIRNKTLISLTTKGKQIFSHLQQQLKIKLPEKNYKTTASAQFTIIVFDIPEKQRKKRDWLRSVLSNLGMKMIQKSVWIGKIKVPEDFIQDLRDLDLLNCVEIFEISKIGSLSRVL